MFGQRKHRGAFGVAFLAWMLCSSCASMAFAAVPCPSAVFTYWFKFHGGDTYIPAVAFDTTIVNTDGDTTRVAFDRGAGSMALRVAGRGWSGERVVERMDVAGVPLGTPVAVAIDFDLDVHVLNDCSGGGCGTHFEATVATASDSVVMDAEIPGPCDFCTREEHTTLSLPVTIIAGTPVEVSFALLYHTSNVAWGRASAVGSYRVSGLPAGARAVTCVGADVTPIRSTTWGGLKSGYR